MNPIDALLKYGGLLVMVGVVVATLGLWLRGRHIVKRGVEVRGTILAVTELSTSSGPDPELSLRVAVRLPDGSACDTQCDGRFSVLELPRVGDTVLLIVDQTDPYQAVLSGDGYLERASS